MKLTIVLIIFGTVISILLFILIKKIGKSSNALSDLPVFSDDTNTPVIAPTIAQQPASPTLTRANLQPLPDGPDGPNTTSNNSPTTTTSSLPQGTLVIDVEGASFNSSQISTDSSKPTRLLQSTGLWGGQDLSVQIKSNGINTNLFSVNTSTGIISGPQNPSDGFYLISIFLQVQALNLQDITISTQFTVTVGLGLPDGNGINRIESTENPSPDNSLPYSAETVGLSTQGQTATQSIPYIYIKDPSGQLRDGTLQFAKIQIVVKKMT